MTKVAPKIKKASMEIDVKRHATGAGDSCDGLAVFYVVGDDSRGHCGLSPEGVLGRPLGTGSRVRVIVEVIKERAMPKKCMNMWSTHQTLAHGKVGKR